MSKRFYIGKKDQADLGYKMEEWIADQIPPLPPNLPCECNHEECHSYAQDTECGRFATTYLYRIEGDHVCYTYVCPDCGEANAAEDYLADQDYPTTEAGYAVVPTRCIQQED